MPPRTMIGKLSAPFAAILCAWALIQPAAADCLKVERAAADPPPPILELAPEARGPTTRDLGGRIIAPVVVNGLGPFRFLVDTGASRSALTTPLAQRLNLPPAGQVEVHGVTEVALSPAARVASLSYGGVFLTSGNLPVLDWPSLVGVDGLLGSDALQGRLLRIDFDANCLEISAARNALRLTGWVRLAGQLRFGNLVAVRGDILGQRIGVVIDTGSDSTLGTLPLRDQLRLRVRRDREPRRSYAAGEPIVLESVVLIPAISLGDPRMQDAVVKANDVRAYVGDFYIFRYWNMQDEPSLLIGMDVLSQTRALAIDYDRGVVYFRLRRRP